MSQRNVDRKSHIGTLIHATMREEDLIPAFTDELERLDSEGQYETLIQEARELIEKGSYKMTDVVRVGVTNNFNCSCQEFKQVDGFAAKYPDKFFFVNSNIRTPKLSHIANHPYKTVVTVNPELIVDPKMVQKLYSLPKDKIAFVRVKYLPKHTEINVLIKELSRKGFKVVVTMQRFKKGETLLKYTSLEHYEHSCGYYRLDGAALKDLHKLVDSLKNVHICDRKGVGCLGCGLCSTLTTGKKGVIKSLNLSTSGLCPYRCPDCYARCLQNFAIKCGHRPIIFDVIAKNKKQSGGTEHIKRALAAQA